MSINQVPSLESFPVEILYHIFDHLDAQTILWSLRNTCRQFRAVATSYDRYIVNFESISKGDFDLLCRLINPCQVKSLILCENEKTFNQIHLFLQHFNLRQFPRLHSLSLFIKKEEQLPVILERFNIRSLKSFSLHIGDSDDRRKTTTARLLSSVIEKLKLLKLELYMRDGRLEKILWPNRCSIQYLSINDISSFNQIYNILLYLPNLETLIINTCSLLILNNTDIKSLLATSFRQLTSLTFKKINSNINELELVLSLIPSLTHLQIIGNGNYCDGNRWEHFIQLNLTLLKKFEFIFEETQNAQLFPADLESILASFKTSFWMEDKQWFVTYEYDIYLLKYIKLFSLPVCHSYLFYEPEKVSIPTFPKIHTDLVSMMDNVNEVKLNLTYPSYIEYQQKANTTNYPLFHKVRKLKLDFDTNRPLGWLTFVLNLIDLSTIMSIEISSTAIRASDPIMLTDLNNLFQRTFNLFSVDICYGFNNRKSSLTAAQICSIIPSHVQHLAVSIKDLNEIESLLKRLEYLSSANFFYDYSLSKENLTQWLNTYRTGSSYQIDGFSSSVWLGKSTSTSSVMKVGHKRVKLTDERH